MSDAASETAGPDRSGPGRPTLYRDAYVDQVYRLALLGLTDKEIAEFFQVSIQTLYNWDEAHPEFLDARARGKAPADAQVAERLYKRALGYSHPAVKIFMPQGAPEPVYADYEEHYPPDTQAATWWLKNRQPKKWKDRSELTGPDGAPVQVETIRRVIVDPKPAVPTHGNDTRHSDG